MASTLATTSTSNTYDAPTRTSTIESLLTSGHSNIFAEMEMFFAESASSAAVNAADVMKRAKASRKANDSRKAFQALASPAAENKFNFGEDAVKAITNWEVTYTELVPSTGLLAAKALPDSNLAERTLRDAKIQEEKDLLEEASKVPGANILRQMNAAGIKLYGDDGKAFEEYKTVKASMDDKILSAAEKAKFDSFMLPTFQRDEDDREVLSDEIMTVMLSQANALYQNWVGSYQKIATSKMETLKELIRALS